MFKVGDRVRVVRNKPYLVNFIGRTGIVTSIMPRGEQNIRVLVDNHNDGNDDPSFPFYEDELELETLPPFQQAVRDYINSELT